MRLRGRGRRTLRRRGSACSTLRASTTPSSARQNRCARPRWNRAHKNRAHKKQAHKKQAHKKQAYKKQAYRNRSRGSREPSAQVALAKARVAWLRGLALERRGRREDAAAETAGLGLVRDWMVAATGPAASGGEDAPSAVDFDAVRASLREAAWRPFRSGGAMARVFLGPLSGRRRSSSALALVRAPADMPAVLLFGTNAPAAVCVNAAAFAAVRGSADADREAFPVRLRKGWNAVLVRGAFDEEDGAFTLRLVTPDGAPFRGEVARPTPENLRSLLAEAEAALRDNAPAGGAAGDGGAENNVLENSAAGNSAAGNSAAASGGQDAVAALSLRVAAHPRDARAGFYLASLLVAKRLMEGPDRFDREILFRRAIADSNGDPFFTLMAARAIDSGVDAPDREENLRIVLLRSVADTGAAAALVDMGRLYLDVMRQPRRAKEYADRALSANSMSLRAGILDYDIAVAMGWEPLAERLLSELARRHPEAAAARLRRGRSALAEGRHRRALTEFHAVLAVRAGSREALDGAVTALGMLGQTSAAADLLLRRIAAFPYDLDARLRLADVYRTLGRDADAERVLDGLLAVAPDAPAALAMREGTPEDAPARAENAAFTAFRQDLDLSPPAREPEEGWEYLYFQVEDRLGEGGAFDRSVSFAFRVYTQRAARLMRRLGVRVENSFAEGRVVRLDIVAPDGSRTAFTPPVRSARGGEELRLLLPAFPAGTTVEAEIALRRGGAAFLGEYFGHIAPFAQDAPVRLSRYIFVSPADRRVFFRPVHSAPEAMVVPSADGTTVTRVWEMSDLPAFREEPFSPGRNALSPCVQVSSFATRDEFARWYWRLIGAQYNAPPELKLMARTLGGGDGAPLAKLDRAAEWIAANIGFREREYGLYAFRPVSARSILSRLSADSKDRTLLLCLLAREYGLQAWPVLAWMRGAPGSSAPPGSPEEELPILNLFNHSLALVRAGAGGDVLLDAGNPHRQPGVMPPALAGSEGLVITPDGAESVIVPEAGSAACAWLEEADLVIDDDGSILWEEKIAAEGLAAQMLRGRFAGSARNAGSAGSGGSAGNARIADDGGESAEWTDFLLSLGADVSVASDAFAAAGEEGGAAGSARWEGRARLRRFVRMGEGRAALAVPPLPGAREERGGAFAYPLAFGETAAAGARSQDLVLPHGFRISRSINVRCPEGWRWANPGVSFRREYPFGTFAVECGETADGVSVRVDAEVPGHRVAAADYPAFREMAALAARWFAPDLVWEREQ